MNLQDQKAIEFTIAKFENGKERYENSVMFAVMVKTLAEGVDPIKVIESLLSAYENLHRDYCEMLFKDGKSSNER